MRIDDVLKKIGIRATDNWYESPIVFGIVSKYCQMYSNATVISPVTIN